MFWSTHVPHSLVNPPRPMMSALVAVAFLSCVIPVAASAEPEPELTFAKGIVLKFASNCEVHKDTAVCMRDRAFCYSALELWHCAV